MTQSKLLRIVGVLSVALLLVPLLVSLFVSNEQSVPQKLASYLQVSSPAANTKQPQVGGTDSDPEVPASNLPGQPVGKQPGAQPGSKLAPAPTNKAGDKAAGTYTVAAGDTYGCIAEKYYGSFEHYAEIMNVNGAGVVPGYSEYQLHVGAKLQLPAIAAAQLKPASTLCK